MKKITYFILSLPILISCGTNTNTKNVLRNSECNKLSLIKSDSIQHNITKEITQLIKDSILTTRNEEYGTESYKSINFNDNPIEIWSEKEYNAMLFQHNNIIILNSLHYSILNTKKKICYIIHQIRESKHTKSLFCYKNFVIFHINEFYDPHYERDLYLIMDKDLNSVKAFAVPALVETVGSEIQDFKYESKNQLFESKNGSLVIKMTITITKEEKNKQNFSVEIPFDEANGTFSDLEKILPLLSSDIPISDVENIVIQDLSKKIIDK